MSADQNDSVNQPVENSVPAENNQVNVNAQDDYKRDMFRYKDEAKTLREQLKEIELEKQQKNGNLEGVIGSLKDEIKKLKHENASSKLSYAETQLNSSIKEELLSRGVSGKKLDAFIRLVEHEDKSIVELDDKFNVNNEDIKSLVDKNMERYGDLFKKEVKFVDGTPNNNSSISNEKKIDISKMSWDDVAKYMKTLKD